MDSQLSAQWPRLARLSVTMPTATSKPKHGSDSVHTIPKTGPSSLAGSPSAIRSGRRTLTFSAVVSPNEHPPASAVFLDGSVPLSAALPIARPPDRQRSTSDTIPRAIRKGELGDLKETRTRPSAQSPSKCCNRIASSSSASKKLAEHKQGAGRFLQNRPFSPSTTRNPNKTNPLTIPPQKTALHQNARHRFWKNIFPLFAIT